jgi:ribosome recycling factor
MAYDFSKFKTDTDKVADWLRGEYKGIRTGMASPALLDRVRVEAYGELMPIVQIATIGMEDARTVRISAWDMSLAKEIEKAISSSDLGVSTAVDDRGVRVSFPELTSERREQLVKLVRDKLEDARVSLRSLRDEVWDDIQASERKKEISEDEKFRYKDEMQKLVDETNKALDAEAERKSAELAK